MYLLGHYVDNSHMCLFSAIQKNISKSIFFSSVNLETFKVDMHLVHSLHNFPNKLSGSADTCWYFIYFVLKTKQSENAKWLTYFLSSFGLIMLGVHYLNNHREKEMSNRTFPHHGGRHVNSYWVKISPMWRTDLPPFGPEPTALWPWARPVTSLSTSQTEWSSNLPPRGH